MTDDSTSETDGSTPGTAPSATDGSDDGVESGSSADGGRTFEPDPDRVAALREIADDVRGDTSESKQLANVLYRTSDLYDPDEETTPEEIVRNVKFILEVVERGGLER